MKRNPKQFIEFCLPSFSKRFMLMVTLLLTGFMFAYAQKITVKGKVTDETKEGLVGVSVLVKGTTIGTTTNMDGDYEITANKGEQLVFSYIGMKNQTITIYSNTMNVQLESNTKVLTEVVAIGYGVSKKQDLTGSITGVNSDEILKQPALTASQAIQGKAPGVNIINSDEPGSSPTVLIRGMGTALGGRNPLYIVDGFAVDDINNISPSDIVSIDILKDASSASIYGVRAANGVFLVTTKKGRSGKPKVTFNSYVGVKSILHSVKMANASQYITYFNEFQNATSADWTLADASEQPANTNWYKELTDLGYSNNNLISVSGGSEDVTYFLSYNNLNEDGILYKQTYDRHTFRNNNVYNFLDKRLKISQNLSLSYTISHPKPSSAFNEAYQQAPIVPLKWSNGRYATPYVNQTTGIIGYESDESSDVIGALNSIGNPVHTSRSTNERDLALTLQGGLEAEFKITDYLKFNTRIGTTKYFSKNRTFVDIKEAYLTSYPTVSEDDFETLQTDNPTVTTYADNSLYLENVETFRYSWENFLTFNKDFNLHHIDANIGYSREKTGIGSENSIKAYGVSSKEQYWSADLADGNYTKTATETSYTPTAFVSYFARAQYNYDSKYYLTGTIRRDGTSTFKDSGKYWGVFPSFGAGWTISREGFFNDKGIVNFLKIRGSWGKLGNQDVPLNVSQILTSTESSDYNYVFGSDQSLVYGAAYGTPAVGLQWEVTREWSVGSDFNLFDYRLSGNIDYYNKTNTNAILYVTPTLDAEYEEDYYAHGATVRNTGFEMSLSWKDNLTKDFSYEIGMNFSTNENKVTKVVSGYDGATGGSLSNGQITKRLKVGQPLYAWWLYEADGVWQNQDEIDNADAVLGSPLPGYLKYKDQNSDGSIDTQDKKYMGSYIPTYNYGIHLGLNYKKLDLSVDGYGVGGNKIYNGLKNVRIDGGENVAYSMYKDRWTSDGSTNKNPGAARDAYASSYYLESGAFFRINNITLGYTLKNVLATQGRLRMYVTAQNPFIITGYSGFSPEISSDGTPNGTAGIEISAYPTTRNFLFGFNLQF